MPGYQVAHGGVPAAEVYGGTPVLHGVPQGSYVQAGGAPWVDEPPVCTSLTKNNELCTAPPIEGDDVCIGHKRARESQKG